MPHSLRIASLVPSLTELLFTLELGNDVVARTGFCVEPRDQVRRIPKVGGTKDVDVDALLAAKPTHLIVNIDENRRETIDSLRARVPHVVVTHPLDPRDNLVLYSEFGRIFDRNSAAAELASRFNEASDALRRFACGLESRNVLYLVWKDPWYAVSRSTYISAMLAGAGLSTLPERSAARYPVIANDDTAWDEADFIFLPSEPYAFRQRHVDELKGLHPTKEIMLVDGALLSWYGSRAIHGLRYVRELRSEIDSLTPHQTRNVKP